MVALTNEQLQKLEAIRRLHGIALIIAFGSKVRGSEHEASDLDLGFFFAQGCYTLDVLFDVQKLLPGQKVDIANLNRADPLFLNEINMNCQLLCGDPEGFLEFRRNAFHRYNDFRPYLKLETAMNRRRLENEQCQ